MPYFSEEREVYEHIGRLFQDLLEEGELVSQFQRADAVVQYRYHDPEATITLDLRSDAVPRVDLGATDLDPEIRLSMAADVAHRFWLGEVNVTVALARGQIKARGPVTKILKLVPLLKPVFPRYRAQLKAGGRADLVTEA